MNSRHQAPSRRVLDEFCKICGKPATGVYYRCTSCNGCRSFFRRSIVFNKDYDCKGMGYDERSCFQRHGCRKCRMALCQASGMDPEAIRVGDVVATAQPELSCQAMQLVPSPPTTVECQLEKLMQGLLIIEDAHHRLRISTYSPKLVAGMSLDDFATGPSKLGMKFPPMNALPYEPISIRFFPEEVGTSDDKTDTAKLKMPLFKTASNAVLSLLVYIKQKIQIDFSTFDYSSRKLWIFQDIVFAMEFIKALPFYHLLSDCSQRVLLASAITCSHFTWAFYSYSQHSDRTCFPDGGVMTWSREIQEQSPDSTRFHTELIAAIRQMIMVCNPMLGGLSPDDVTLLQHEKERHTKTLLSYVLVRRGVTEGPAAFTQILAIAEVLMRLSTWKKSQHILILAMGLHRFHIPFVESIFHSN